MSKERAKPRTYADFKVGDVFVGMRFNNDFFVIVGAVGNRFDVLNLRTGVKLDGYLELNYPVPPGYDVYRGVELIASN